MQGYHVREEIARIDSRINQTRNLIGRKPNITIHDNTARGVNVKLLLEDNPSHREDLDKWMNAQRTPPTSYFTEPHHTHHHTAPHEHQGISQQEGKHHILVNRTIEPNRTGFSFDKSGFEISRNENSMYGRPPPDNTPTHFLSKDIRTGVSRYYQQSFSPSHYYPETPLNKGVTGTKTVTTGTTTGVSSQLHSYATFSHISPNSTVIQRGTPEPIGHGDVQQPNHQEIKAQPAKTEKRVEFSNTTDGVMQSEREQPKRDQKNKGQSKRQSRGIRTVQSKQTDRSIGSASKQKPIESTYKRKSIFGASSTNRLKSKDLFTLGFSTPEKHLKKTYLKIMESRQRSTSKKRDSETYSFRGSRNKISEQQPYTISKPREDLFEKHKKIEIDRMKKSAIKSHETASELLRKARGISGREDMVLKGERLPRTSPRERRSTSRSMSEKAKEVTERLYSRANHSNLPCKHYLKFSEQVQYQRYEETIKESLFISKNVKKAERQRIFTNLREREPAQNLWPTRMTELAYLHKQNN